MDRDHIHNYLVWIFGENEAEKRAQRFLDNLEIQLGGWVRGQVILMFAVGFITYLGLVFLGIPYAVPLAIIAGLLEVIPNIGPFISSLPAIFIALFLVNPYAALFVTILYILVQQLENNLLVPRIMSDAANVSPFIAIVVLIVGLQLGGVLGTILSIPTFLFLRTIVQEYYDGENSLRGLNRSDEPKKLSKSSTSQTKSERK